MNDLPQTFMEPILFKTACKRGTREDEHRVQVPCAGCRRRHHDLVDRMTGQELTIRSKFLIGADGGNLVAENENLPMEGKMGVGGSMNIYLPTFQYVAHRPSVLYWVMQPGADVGGIGGLVRCIRP